MCQRHWESQAPTKTGMCKHVGVGSVADRHSARVKADTQTHRLPPSFAPPPRSHSPFLCHTHELLYVPRQSVRMRTINILRGSRALVCVLVRSRMFARASVPCIRWWIYCCRSFLMRIKQKCSRRIIYKKSSGACAVSSASILNASTIASSRNLSAHVCSWNECDYFGQEHARMLICT